MDLDDILAVIKDGILNNNMQQVCDGYNAITGEDLVLPVTPQTRELSMKEKLELRMTSLKKKSEPVTGYRDETTVTEQPVGLKQRGRMPVKAGKTQFITDSNFELDSDEKLEVDEAKKEKLKNARFKRSPRRAPAREITVQCRDCKKMLTIPASYLRKIDEETPSYTCSECLRG